MEQGSSNMLLKRSRGSFSFSLRLRFAFVFVSTICKIRLRSCDRALCWAFGRTVFIFQRYKTNAQNAVLLDPWDGRGLSCIPRLRHYVAVKSYLEFHCYRYMGPARGPSRANRPIIYPPTFY